MAQSQQLRIIGGLYKRRILPFAPIPGLRPTPDRVRETVFNWLMWDIQNAEVLDVCAGSGALSFEALSRGAAHATLIEPNRKQCQFLEQNAQLLNCQNLTIFNQTAEQALIGLQHTFDVIFLDPPYALDLWENLAILLQPLLKPTTLIYVEANRELTNLGLPTDWSLSKSMRAGQIHAGLYVIQTI